MDKEKIILDDISILTFIKNKLTFIVCVVTRLHKFVKETLLQLKILSDLHTFIGGVLNTHYHQYVGYLYKNETEKFWS